MKTSHHITGFWFHITWNGNEGIDQHGCKWINPDQPEKKHYHKILVAVCEIQADIAKTILKLKRKQTP